MSHRFGWLCAAAGHSCIYSRVKRLKLNDIALRDKSSQSYEASLAVWDHTVLPGYQGDLLHTDYRDGLPVRRWSPIQVLTGPSVG